MYVPVATIKRLPTYLEYLNKRKVYQIYIKSSLIAQKLELASSSVRRDFSFIAASGTKGHGYKIDELITTIKNIIGQENEENIILIGYGNLGKALLKYNDINGSTGKIVAVFDQRNQQCNTVYQATNILCLSELDSIIENKQVKIAILAIPGPEVLHLYHLLVKKRIVCFINFTTKKLPFIPGIKIKNISLNDIVCEMVFALKKGE